MRVTVQRFILITGLVILTIIVYWSGLRDYLKMEPSMFVLEAVISKPSKTYATNGIPHGNMITNIERHAERLRSNLNVSQNNSFNVNNTRITVVTSQNTTSRNDDNIITTTLALSWGEENNTLSTKSESSSQKLMKINNTTTDLKIATSKPTKIENTTTTSVNVTLTYTINTTSATTTLDKLPNTTSEYSKTSNVTIRSGNVSSTVDNRTAEKTSNVTIQSGNVSSTVDNRTAEKTSNGSSNDNKHNVSLLYVAADDLTNGRLGNQMFRYASLLGIARSQHRTLVVPSGSDLQNTFKLHHVADMQETSGWPVLYEEHAYAFDTRLMNLTNQNVRINGFFQSYKYFHDHADEVRQEYVFADSIANEAYLIVHNLVSKRKGTLFVGVHIRRGDFLSDRNRNLGYGVPEKSYFLKAFNWMQSKFPNRNITYLVASDDLKWCNENLSNDNVFPLPDASPAIHMAILSSCDHMIMSGGTYGWWGSFLAGGYVVYFKGFMSRGTTFGDSFNPDVYYPPLWIGMDN